MIDVNGSGEGGQLTILQAINKALGDAMSEDGRVFVLGEDVADLEGGGVVGVTSGLSSRFGEDRVRSTPISEQAIMGAAIGASIAGYRPVPEIMLMNFTTVAMDMIVNHAAKLRFMSGGQTHVPITIRTMTGAGYGTGGQHSDYLEAWFAHTPGIKVVAPSMPADAYGLLRSCIEDEDPCLFIENITLYGKIGPGCTSDHRVPIGKARMVAEGSDLSLVTYARMTYESQAALELLRKEGISVDLIDLRSVAPWDKSTVLDSVAKTGRALIVHEAVTEFGVGAEITAVIAQEHFGRLKAPVMRMGAVRAPVPVSKPLESAHSPNAERIAAKIRELLG
jgi:pyruvate dehydrogenase E1 component beta subunit